MSTREDRWRAIDAAVFRTISSEDCRRFIVAARAAPNRVREQIAAKLLDLKNRSLPNPKDEPRRNH